MLIEIILYILLVNCPKFKQEDAIDYYNVQNYFIDAESFFAYPIEFMECNSVPKIINRLVRSLSDSKKVYLKEVAYVSHLDSETEGHVPPQSILDDINLQKEIIYLYKLPAHQLGSFGYTMIICHLIDNVDWISSFYNKYIDQNNKALIAVMDIVYRLALCLRNIDSEVNCPNPCNAKIERCKNMGNSTGTCQSVMSDKINDYSIGQVPSGHQKDVASMKKEFLKWYSKIPRNKKLSLSFLNMKADNKLFLQILGLQYAAALDGQCNCRMYFKYDFFLDTCTEDYDAIFCKTINSCQNGGECERDKDSNGIPLSKVKCKCPPAFKGQFCELERNPCAEEPPATTCGDFTCLRDINNVKEGFRCRCPRNTYKVESIDNAKCIDVNECETTKPCQNGGICHNLVGSYFCGCKTGFEGQNCEILPPDPLWSEWSEWSNCFIPSKFEVCFQMPYRLQNRECETNVIKQRCIGPRRRLQYVCPGVQMDDIYHFCSQAQSASFATISEDKLGETIDYYLPDDLGVDEEMPQRDIEGPESLPDTSDVTYFIFCMLIICVQVFFIYKWISVLLYVFGPPRKSKQFQGLTFEDMVKKEMEEKETRQSSKTFRLHKSLIDEKKIKSIK